MQHQKKKITDIILPHQEKEINEITLKSEKENYWNNIVTSGKRKITEITFATSEKENY